MLKAILRGETTKMSYKEARDACQWSDKFVLSSDNILYYVGPTRRKSEDDQPGLSLRLVVPTTMIQEVLQNCHDSNIKVSFDRIRGSIKSAPQLKGYSPGNVLAERPFQVVLMVSLSRRRSLVEAIQPYYSDSVVDWLKSSKIYRRFGVPSLIRHDRDPRFMSEVFQAFAELIQARSRSTLSYRPQANGQQERSVKTVMQSVKVFVEYPLQQDWDEIAERLVFAINNSHDMTRKETSFYLVHGWDAHTNLRAMTTSQRHWPGGEK
ncbi:reverse transcriptase [Phytophthora megakarya]|uniref:Reverse transcriptase n=1 Tax=Phytophthora megakarya TaxID=4795 RepID=A0A225UTN4_9STRA|nr:reverse transcriptase [Phytophthora megakarya]